MLKLSHFSLCFQKGEQFQYNIQRHDQPLSQNKERLHVPARKTPVPQRGMQQDIAEENQCQ